MTISAKCLLRELKVINDITTARKSISSYERDDTSPLNAKELFGLKGISMAYRHDCAAISEEIATPGHGGGQHMRCRFFFQTPFREWEV
jgi:hypothetical protein